MNGRSPLGSAAHRGTNINVSSQREVIKAKLEKDWHIVAVAQTPLSCFFVRACSLDTNITPRPALSLSFSAFSLPACLRSSYLTPPNTSLARTHPEDACCIPDANVLEDRKDLQRRIQQSIAPASNMRAMVLILHHVPRGAHSEHCLPKPTPGQDTMHRI
jgi:hypothetical protein